MALANTVVVLDFETTGLSPDEGDRAIEIGAVRLVDGEIVDHFQELMDPGRRVSGFIEDYTGITNSMLSGADSCAAVMRRFSDFIQDDNLVAHNASFDKRFLDAEFSRISTTYRGEFSCSLLATRRIFQAAPNHQLGTLVKYNNIESSGGFHRALYDSEMTAHVWNKMLLSLAQHYSLGEVSFELIQKINKTPKKQIHKFLTKHAQDLQN
ncbi:MAG: DNA polymerase-3 subunit epsilon [Pseudomonadales bacterium]|jgi:DNA polymerase-3 subunit epsilon